MKKNEPKIIIGAINNGNKGKLFFLIKLSGYNIPKYYSSLFSEKIPIYIYYNNIIRFLIFLFF